MSSLKKCFPLTSLLILFVTAASATEHQVHPPWELLDPNDPNVINAAKFAVLEYNKNVTSSSNKLLFQKVNWCEYAYLAGAFYGLDIAAKNESLPSPPQNYIVGVWARLNRPLKLRGFRKATGDE
ncbi:uncharacterized protein LOC109949759 [Prunus persica]|uniref:uncharacterized protein LOC109949758 n=1 Tax=Prunus persica TaxID=3760 RepID=UPI0009AB66E5|nr:uncharacterized protein LOC109949758 [Prunus persica]XP_020421502.1 uncharacterized protein LOC109949759 [Prunus persica]